MKRWTVWLLAGIAASSVSALRESRAESPPTAPGGSGAPAPRATVSLAMRFGVATAPFYTSNFPSVRGHGSVFAVSGSYAISATEELGLALPAALVSIEQPAGAYVDEASWGNPTLSVTHRRASDVAGRRTFRWFGRLGLSLPLAEHGAPGALLSNRALAIASALDGWRDQEAYFPGRLSLTPSGGLDVSSPLWKLEASLKLPFSFEVADANLPDDSDAHAVGFAPVIHIGADVQVVRWLIVGANADLVLNAMPALEGARSELQTAELALRPELSFPLSRSLLLTADFMAVIGDSLGGSIFSGSLLLGSSW